VPFEPLPTPSVARSTFSRLERAAKKFPNKVAVTDGTVSLTYAELLDRCYGLANQIVQAVKPGGVVASLVHNGPAATCTIAAALAAGRTFIPIDAGHPTERQTVLFAESHADAVIVEKSAQIDASVLPPDATIVELDLSRPSGLTHYEEPPKGNGPTMVTFTSGSTGRPKGLAFGLANAEGLPDHVAKFHFNADDVFVSLASMSQTGMGDLLALSVGATLHVVDIRRIGIAQGLRAMKEAGITYLAFVPSVLRTFMGVLGIEEALGKLRLLSLHGERILASDIKLFRSKLPVDCKIHITFGSTEAGLIFSWFVRDEAIEGATAPIGYLVKGKRVALVSEGGRSAPPGEVGELLVRGPMALGSWQDGHVTPARFLPDPDDPTSKIYVTGDLVRQRPDKLFEFVGRRDRQVKIRGLWADLGEIESALRAADNIDDAVVVVRSAEGQPDTLTAFVTLADPMAPLDLALARRAALTGTAEHMVPSDIRVLPAIPRLANYKPDLQRLDAML
jgi:acyl-coenzyme A synthetase/AMP-(fatty) acid ligase